MFYLVQEDNKWYLDSGCSRHMTGIRENLSEFVEEDGPSVKYGDNSIAKTKGYGLVRKDNQGCLCSRVEA